MTCMGVRSLCLGLWFVPTCVIHVLFSFSLLSLSPVMPTTVSEQLLFSLLALLIRKTF